MSLFTYNGITLPYVTTNRFSQRAMREESDTDWFCTEFDIEVQCILNTDYLSVVAPSLMGQGLNAADIMAFIRSKLLEHRRTLSFTFNGVQLIPGATAGPGTVDVMNGPKPQEFNALQLSNTTFLCTYHIIAHYWENNSATFGGSPTVVNNAGNNVLFNRWSEELDLDNCQYAKRVREGKFMIRSDNSDGLTVAQLMPQTCIVGVPKGFLRQSSRYKVDPNGLAIEYTVIDQEVYRMPPYPAYEARGEYTESTGRMGVKRYADLRIQLKGSKTTSQANLVRVAAGIASRKLRLVGAPINGVPKAERGIPESAAIRVGMWENEVELTMRVMFPAGAKRAAQIAMMTTNLVSLPGVDDVQQPTPVYKLTGTSARLLHACAYYDPSLSNLKLDPTNGQVGPGLLSPGTAGVQKES